MVNSKLITLLRTLSKVELKAFEYYINSTKQSIEVVQFFNYLKRYHPLYTNKYLSKAAFCKQFYQDLEPGSQKVAKMMSKLVDYLNEFLIQQELAKDEVKKDFLLLSVYQNRRLDDLFFKTVRKIEKKWENEKPPGINQLYHEFNLKQMCFMHPSYAKIDRKTNNLSSIGPENLLEHIDRYYFAIKLYLTLCLRHTQIYISNPNKFTKKEYLTDEIIKITLDGNFDDSLQIRWLGQILHSLSNNFENFDLLKEDFITTSKSFNKKENVDIVYFLYAICYENYKMGRPNALNKLFELNSLMVKYDFLLDDGYITTNLFLNIINIGLAAKKLAWTKSFIAEYGKFLKEAEKEDILCISNSQLAFEEENFNESLQYLLTVKFHNIFYGLRARAIQLKCYYELGLDYEEPFFSLIKSFSDFMRRNNFSVQLQKGVLNYISFTKKLYLIKFNLHHKKKKSIIMKLNTKENVAYKSWLNNKVIELEQKSTGKW